jgi:hypothetical protein
VARPDAVTDDPARDAYVLEKPVTFNDGVRKKSTGRLDLYKRGCFKLETKQGTTSLDEQQEVERKVVTALGYGPTTKRRKAHALRGTAKWEQMMPQAYGQALRVRAGPAAQRAAAAVRGGGGCWVLLRAVRQLPAVLTPLRGMVLRIGYRQWHLRTHDPTDLREPLLDSFRNVENRAAVHHRPARYTFDPPSPRKCTA